MVSNTFTESFQNIIDFRQQGKVLHKLIDILFIAVVATITNADNWTEVEAFSETKEEWFKKYIKLEHASPHMIHLKEFFEIWIAKNLVRRLLVGQMELHIIQKVELLLLMERHQED